MWQCLLICRLITSFPVAGVIYLHTQSLLEVRVLKNDLCDIFSRKLIYIPQGPGDKTSHSEVMNNIFDLIQSS